MKIRTTIGVSLLACAIAGVALASRAQPEAQRGDTQQPEMRPPTGIVTPAHRVPVIGDFAPMAGHWRTEAQGRVYEEVWLPPRNGQMTGAMRSFDADGKLLLLELLTIAEIEGGVEYRLRHFDAEMTPWESEAESPLIMRGSRFVDGRVLFDEVEGADTLAGAIIDLGTPDRMSFVLSFSKDTGGGAFRLTFERIGSEKAADEETPATPED